MELKELLDRVGEQIDEDVRAEIKAHPDYIAAVQHLVSLGVSEAIRIASSAA